MDLNIRPALPTDADAVGALHHDVWRQAYGQVLPQAYWRRATKDWRIAAWRAALAQVPPEVTHLVAEKDGELAGFVTVGPSRDGGAEGHTELRALNVHPGRQGERIADALLERALDGADAYLWLLEGNVRAERFFARHGFVTDGERKLHRPSQVVEFRMARGGPVPPHQDSLGD